METWRGSPAAVQAAQQAFLHRARLVSAARDGRYTPQMEQAGMGTGGGRR
jgi:fructose-bisphosphate aldolase class I